MASDVLKVSVMVNKFILSALSLNYFSLLFRQAVNMMSDLWISKLQWMFLNIFDLQKQKHHALGLNWQIWCQCDSFNRGYCGNTLGTDARIDGRMAAQTDGQAANLKTLCLAPRNNCFYINFHCYLKFVRALG